MSPRRIVATALGAALSLTALPRDALALEIAQVTQHGYILVDEPGSTAPYEGSAGAANVASFAGFIADVTATLDAAGAPHGDFVAVMQQTYEPSVLAFYVRIRNQTRGVGDRSPQGGNFETYDLNPVFGNIWPIDGAVFLNATGIYLGSFSGYGVRVICPQEFGHRFMAEIHVPPVPGAPMPDDAGTDATADDGGMDAGPQAVDILLGRDRAHWSYFMNTGGSPMEGNAWEEISPGVFRTAMGSLTFSPLELYLMGLAPASSVPPFFIIANPDVMGQRDQGGNIINRASPPEDFGFGQRQVEIRGTRVTYTIDDVIRANGPRVPAYFDPDAGQSDDSGTVSVRQMNTTWVLLTTSDTLAMDPRIPGQFDQAIEACQNGYEEATNHLAHITPVVTHPPDAGMEAGTDAATDATSDADGSMGPHPFHATGGCDCATLPVRTDAREGVLAVAALGLAGMTLARRRRSR